jgi:DNA mismatch endonuclease, patch repair protein
VPPSILVTFLYNSEELKLEPGGHARERERHSRSCFRRISIQKCSENMRRIRSKNTNPEVLLRKVLYGLGYRFRLHRSDLPGKTDLVFSSKRKVIFVHGCFWHQHRKCVDGRLPKTNTGYWRPKLERNVVRDFDSLAKLNSLGWQVFTVWECELNDLGRLTKALKQFLGRPGVRLNK